MSWREYFGVTEEVETLQPGHTLGLCIFYVVAGVCLIALAFGAAHS